MENSNVDYVAVPVKPTETEDGFDTIQKLLMLFIIGLTVCMFSFWGYQAVMYILSVMFSVATEYTPYDMFIGIIAMAASVLMFTGSFLWWKKNLKAETFLKYGAIFFVIKDTLEIPNAIVPMTKLDVVTRYDLTTAASAIGYDLFKIAFWVFSLVIFMYAIKKHKAKQQ